MNPPVVTVAERADIEAAIGEAINRRAELERRALDFAANHTWGAVFERAKKKIEELAGV